MSKQESCAFIAPLGTGDTQVDGGAGTKQNAPVRASGLLSRAFIHKTRNSKYRFHAERAPPAAPRAAKEKLSESGQRRGLSPWEERRDEENAAGREESEGRAWEPGREGAAPGNEGAAGTGGFGRAESRIPNPEPPVPVPVPASPQPPPPPTARAHCRPPPAIGRFERAWRCVPDVRPREPAAAAAGRAGSCSSPLLGQWRRVELGAFSPSQPG